MVKSLFYFLSSISLAANAKNISDKDYAEVFGKFEGCFILYDVKEQKIVTEYSKNNRCNKRFPSNSTFKIPLSLMAFDQGIINKDTVFKWNGKTEQIPDHNQDQTPATWEKYSVVWVSRQLTSKLGLPKIKRYLAGFEYGNQDFSGDPGKNNGLTNAWLSSSLKISPKEQLNFLNAMIKKELPVNDNAINETMKNIYQGKINNNVDFYGKTGSGWKIRNENLDQKGKHREGWYVGFAEKENKQYIYVSSIGDKEKPTDKDSRYGGPAAKEIAIQILNNYFDEAKISK